MGGIAVFGAANVDIGGFPHAPLGMGDSNPGCVRVSLGGVGRNIACNLAHMGAAVELITALGSDDAAKLVRSGCAQAGIDLTHAVAFPDAATSTYLFIAQHDGDMALAVNDMGIHDRMTPAVVAPILDSIDPSVIVLDANLPEETLTCIAERADTSIVADAVSAVKVHRLKGALPQIARFKPNRLEAEALTGIAIKEPTDAIRAVEAMLGMGAAEVYLTLGTQGLCFGRAGDIRFWPGLALPMVNATGAGDAFTAALAWSLNKGAVMTESALAGLAAASIAVEAQETVNPDMTEELLYMRMEEMRRHYEKYM